MNPEPRIVHRPAFWVVGMRISTRVMAAEIPALWQRFVPRMGDVARIAEPGVSYGVMDRFDPAAGTLDYMAAVAVNDPEELPEGMVGAEIPANTYAVFEATMPTLGEVFGHIFNRWMAASAFEQVRAPHFERYGESFDLADPAAVIEIHMPVRARGG